MLSRRKFIAAGLTLPAGVLLGGEVAEARRRNIVVSDSTEREFGPVLFVSDSTSILLHRTVHRTMTAYGLGPYRIDYLKGRSISRYRRGYPSGAAAVRESRAAGFDPPTYLFALGANDLRYTRSQAGFDVLFDRLLNEIGADRVVGFLNMHSTVRRMSVSFNRFNHYLNVAAKRWPNVHVINWASLARRHRAWHLPDGFHYTRHGAHQRNVFLAQTMVNLVEITRAQNPGPPPPGSPTGAF